MNNKKLNIDAVRELLRSKALRATPARIAVIRFLQESDHPMTHLDVTEKLVLEGYEKSTILRALADMTEVGLVRKMELGDHVWRFERIGESEGDGSAHPHLLCVDCGNIQCLDDNQVELKTSQSVGEIHDVLLKGRCSDCRDGE